MGVRFEIIEDANLPTFAHEQICDVRTDEASATSYKRAFAHWAVKIR
jgi:hypothetical protein